MANTSHVPVDGSGSSKCPIDLAHWLQLAHFTIGDNPLNHSIFGVSIAMKIILVKSPNMSKWAYCICNQAPFGAIPHFQSYI